MSVSVVGLGKIGTAIVPHLLALGEEVRVWNRSPAAVEKMVALGATPLNDVGAAFASELVLSALFDDAAVREIITREAIAAAPGRGTLHVCLSTLSPNLADELTLAHQSAGIGYLSAPLFGRPEAVEKKAANICVAGDAGLLEKARPYLESFGRVWAVGHEPRQASVAKLCGNFLIGAAVAAIAETASILNAENADTDAFMTLMTETLFASPIYRNYAPSITGARPLPASGLALPIKDMGLLATITAEHQLSARVLKALRENLSQAQDMGFGAEDWSTALGRSARIASAVA